MYLEHMLFNYIFEYKLISFKKFVLTSYPKRSRLIEKTNTQFKSS